MADSNNLLQSLQTSGFLNSPERINELIESISIELARNDPNEFNRLCFTNERGEPWEIEEPHREWQALITPYGTTCRVLIIAPHGSGKSSQLSIGRVIWEIGKHPSIRVRVLCADGDLAEAFIQELKTHIMHNPMVKKIFPHLEPAQPWTKNQLTVKRAVIMKDPTVQAESILGGSTGGRCDFLLADDVCTLRNTVQAPKMMPMVTTAFKNVWLNTLSPEGRAVYVNTPWHKRDCTSTLEADREWTIWKKPVIDPLTGIPLLKKFTAAYRRQKRKELGPRFYARGFELKAIDDSERTFPDNTIYKDTTLAWGSPVPREWVRFGALDPSSSAGRGAFLTVALDPDTHRRIPLELLIFRDMTPAESAEAVIGSFVRWRHDLIGVENNATQESFLDLIRVLRINLSETLPTLPLLPLHTGKNKWDPAIGLPALASKMKEGVWRIPYACLGCGEIPCIDHGSDCECVSCEWVEELETHPQSRGDIVMTQWFIERLITDYEFDHAEGEIEDNFYISKESELTRQF